MKRIRWISLIVSWASFVCLCSVGFSAWYQFDPVNVGASGNFVSYDPVGMNDCVSAEEGSFTIFEYSSLSFVTSDAAGRTETDTGEISVVYVVNHANAKKAIEDAGKTWNGTLNVTVSLSYENIADYGEGTNFKGLFLPRTDARTDSKKEIKILVNGTQFTGTVNNSGTELTFTYPLSNLAATGQTTLNLVYQFNVPECYTGGTEVGNFSDNFGKYLKTAQSEDGKATQFITSAKLEELLSSAS